jgi:hypothetical protein
VPAIDESELDLRTAAGTAEELQREWLKGARVALLHGRMERETRQHVMERFRQHLIDVLVATTVIEVGVDVANASVMVIEDADRFGLSQSLGLGPPLRVHRRRGVDAPRARRPKMIEQARREITRAEVRGCFRCAVAGRHAMAESASRRPRAAGRQLADSRSPGGRAMGGGGAIRKPR